MSLNDSGGAGTLSPRAAATTNTSPDQADQHPQGSAAERRRRAAARARLRRHLAGPKGGDAS